MKAIRVFALIIATLLPASVLAQQARVALRIPAELTDSAIESVATEVAGEALATGEPLNGSQRAWLELAAGRYDAATKVLHSRSEEDRSFTPLEVFASAKAREAVKPGNFPDALIAAFRELYATLDDKSAYAASEWMGAPPPEIMRKRVVAFLEGKRGADRLSVEESVELSRVYALFESYRATGPYTGKLVAEDNARRYVIDEDLLIPTPDGRMVNAIVVRPRSAGKLPTLLTFTIYTYPRRLSEAIQAASNGFVGVVGFTRGKRNSPGPALPYEHDGDDARALIEWIATQPWSDGRVGMFGGSYDGFTQWAAAKKMPAALKAIMPSVTVAPGIDVPMQGNIFVNFVYPFPFYTTNTKLLDDAAYYDTERWNRLDKTWYASGKPYRSLDEIDGTPNPIFRRWIDHPGYDKYWQDMIPYGNEFGKIDIPVLQTFGYYGDGGQGAIYYFIQHRKYNPRADHTLLMGPYDHVGGQYLSADVLDGYRIDPVARMNIPRLRYEWFTYLFKNGPKPALLQDVVNYEVMGADKWGHAASIEQMSNAKLRLYLASGASGLPTIARAKPRSSTSLVQTVDLSDRSDADIARPDLIVARTIDSRNGLVFAGDPLERDTEVSGLFSGHLDLVLDRKDVDIEVQLFEQMASGEYFRLSYSRFRASFVRDRSVRRLLEPRKKQRLDFRSEILTSRLMHKGSRIVIVLGIVKGPHAQINYGSGKDVSDESLRDAAKPMQVKWFSDSYIDLPVKY
jgi:uncharacterized protein